MPASDNSCRSTYRSGPAGKSHLSSFPIRVQRLNVRQVLTDKIQAGNDWNVGVTRQRTMEQVHVRRCGLMGYPSRLMHSVIGRSFCTVITRSAISVAQALNAGGHGPRMCARNEGRGSCWPARIRRGRGQRPMARCGRRRMHLPRGPARPDLPALRRRPRRRS